MFRIFEWARSNKELVISFALAAIIYALYAYERIGILSVIIILTIFITLTYLHEARVAKASALISSRIAPLGVSCRQLTRYFNSKVAKAAPASDIALAFDMGNVRSDIDDFFSMSDLPSELISSLPIDKLIELDKLSIIMLRVKEFLETDMKEIDDSDIDGLHSWCNKLIASIAIIEHHDV